MKHQELERFLEIVDINDPVEDVFRIIDCIDVEDNRISINEWMDYFTNSQINPGVYKIKEHIESTITWSLLVKALRIFEEIDIDHSGKLYSTLYIVTKC